MNEQPDTHASPAQTHPQAESSLKETFESIIIAFILAFVFRAFVVEAFVIPTGSMAPTLLGQHVRLVCPQCGYRFSAGPVSYGRDAQGHHTASSIQNLTDDRYYPVCPMCEYPILKPEALLDAGDRILVLKYVYAFSEPRRWDVVVFKNPQRPEQNYIKRLVGLPEEELWVVRGNVYTRRATNQPWQIERKPAEVQQVVWQPVYHSGYMPLDRGEISSESLRRRPWQPPWQPRGETAPQWSPRDAGRALHFDPVDGSVGELGFDFNRRTATDFYGYNIRGHDPQDPESIVEDLRIAATVDPDASGAELTLRLKTHRAEGTAHIAADGSVTLTSRVGEADPQVMRTQIGALAVGTTSRFELWHVDQAWWLWRDGRQVLRINYEDQIAGATLAEWNERRLSDPPKVSITVSGAPVTVSRLHLDRDLYYTAGRHPSVRATRNGPFHIDTDQFFCMGDNSPQSEDSRLWQDVNPWIEMATGVPPGVVPRKMMLGRAFFVYFPAPYRLKSDWPWMIPNFGRMRFIH
jgi:signal peptidase I